MCLHDFGMGYSDLESDRLLAENVTRPLAKWIAEATALPSL